MARVECPCGESTSIHRSRMRWYEYPLRLGSSRPYRCIICKERFWATPNASSRNTYSDSNLPNGEVA
ncbi:hypothetical protein FF011L_18760 [Roseimaritima multifibrata]|uniref:Uncharacterized protein n=1 Tax=Roseimaritima multifibrata TaxID=1930274 RepID=A0A517ME07_9BACT|nr:hypothetical protein [Roseimaritima multifibrata]QDS93121.1 hypothetical protein FF011L_18760 [Roseimaritima multifibrata]